jgi:hypothetical protein
LKVAIPIFNATFPGCQAVFLFENASNHSSYAADALRVDNTNLHPEGKQALLRNGFIHEKGIPQPMKFPAHYYDRDLAGKPKGIMRVLQERGLWPERGLVLKCPVTHNRPGCDHHGSVLVEFLEQKRIFEIRKDAYRKRLKI